MLQDNPAKSNIGYAQIGYYRNDAAGGCHCERFFWQYSQTGGSYVGAVWGNPVSDDTQAFRVDWQVGDGKIHLFYDTNLDDIYEVPPKNGFGDPAVTPFNPGTAWDWQIPFFDAEILYQQSTYKGTAFDPTDFTLMQMRESDGSTLWINTDVQSSSGSWQQTSSLPNKGFQDTQSDTFIRIWN